MTSLPQFMIKRNFLKNLPLKYPPPPPHLIINLPDGMIVIIDYKLTTY